MTPGAEDGKLLASVGEDIRYWSIPRLDQVECKNFGTSINAICWSPTCLFLAAALESSGISIIGHKENYESFTLSTKSEQFCISVSDNSRYLLTGGKDSIVSIWDLKYKTVKKSYKEHQDTVFCACFNRKFTNIASGDASGDIFIHNTSTDVVDGPLREDKTQAVRAIQYSLFRKGIFAAVSDDAVLNLWDSDKKELIKSFSTEHKAPASDLSFSPVNDMLLASAGLDKRLIFYDVFGKKSVKTIETESPLVSVEFFNDGATIAAGATSGKIFIFDLRSGSKPIRVRQAHRTSVRCIAIQRPSKAAEKGITSKTTEVKANGPKSKEQHKPTLPTPVVDVKPQVREKPVTSHSPQASQINGDVFSPLKDDSSREFSDTPASKNDISLSSSNELSIALGDTQKKPIERPELIRRGVSDLSSYSRNIEGAADGQMEKRQQRESGSDASVGETDTLDIFSPAVPFRKNNGDYLSRQKKNSTGSTGSPLSRGDFLYEYGRQGWRADVRRPSAPSDISSSVNMLKAELTQSVVPDSKKPELNSVTEVGIKLNKEAKATSLATAIADIGFKSALGVTRQRNGSDNDITSPSLPIQNAAAVNQPVIDFENAGEDKLVARTLQSLDLGGEMKPKEHVGIEGSQPVLHPFQIEYIRNMIEDAMEESRTSIHHDLVNLQIEVLRQLQIQQDEIKRIVEQYSINEELVKENERLREEIKNLKTKY